MNQRGFVLPSPLMLVGGVALAFGISTLMFWRLYQGAVDDFAHFKSAVEAQQEQIRLENESKLAAMAAVQARTEAGWRTALDELRKRGTIRVQPLRCPGEVQSVSIAVGRADETTAQPAASAERSITVEQCEAVANNAVQDAAQVIHLQHWIKQQHEASK